MDTDSTRMDTASLVGCATVTPGPKPGALCMADLRLTILITLLGLGNLSVGEL